MRIRVVTLNLEQDHKRWDQRYPLIVEGMKALKPDLIALNEVSIALQTAKLLQKSVGTALGAQYNLVQQTRVNSLATIEGEALLSRFPVVETGNFDFQTRDIVAQVARVLVDGRLVDVYVTHLFMSRGEDSLRLFQVQKLLEWIDSRNDVIDRIVCGDFNATLDMPSAALMASRFRPTQTGPTAFTPLAGADRTISHPSWPRMDRCIDYIWIAGNIDILASGISFDGHHPNDTSLWPSDHAGVWADLKI